MKKLFALAIIASFLISMLPLVAPAGARLTPEIFVSPPKKKFYAPCNVSTTFDIEVKIFNEFEDTGAEIYGLDFHLFWDSTLLTLTKVEILPPYNDPTKYFIIRNENGSMLWDPGATPNNPDWPAKEYDYIWVAFTALDTTPGIKDKVPVVKLTFHIDHEPIWPDVLMSPFWFDLVTMSGACGEPLPYGFDVEHGDFIIASTKPDMEIKPTEVIEGCICKDYTFEIVLTNMQGVYGFGFRLLFPGNRLEANLQCIKVLFPQPFVFQFMDVGDGYVEVIVERPCVKPPVSCGNMTAITICLHTIYEEMEEELPTKEDFPITFEWAYVLSKADYDCDGIYEVTARYDYPVLDPLYPLIVNSAMYYWRPKPQDLDLSCHVDIVDLGAIAAVYGTAHVWHELADPAGDLDLVDLYDVVEVAKLFCKTIPLVK